MSDNLDTLRDELFSTIRGLKDKSIDINIARAVVETAKVIVDTAKVETDHLRVTGRKTGSGFIQLKENPLLKKPEGVPPPKLSDDGKGYTGTPKLRHG